MDLTVKNSNRWRPYNQFFAGLCIALLVVSTGCPSVTPGPGTDPPPGTDVPEEVTAELITPVSSISISVREEPISILYTVTGDPDLDDENNSIIGFRIEVADSTPNSVAIGEEVVIATNLPAGENQAFNFDPLLSGIGSFRFGIVVTVDGVVIRKESEAVISVEGSPDPRFISPLKSITTVRQGTNVTIKADARDPENAVHWRLFFLSTNDPTDVPADQLGTPLLTGTGNIAEYLFISEGFSPGDYEIGFSATDSGFSIASTVSRGLESRIATIPTTDTKGPIIRVVEPDAPILPTLTFSQPGSSETVLFGNEAFNIVFSASADEPNATPTMKIFYDDDRNPDNGITSLNNNVSINTTSIAFPTNLDEGTYFVGGTIDDGINEAVTEYADGSIRKIEFASVTLVVNTPNELVTVKPDENVNISWSTNAPETLGTISVSAQRINGAGEPEGVATNLLVNVPVSVTSTVFSHDSAGLFEISVTLLLRDGRTITEKAAGRIRVSTLPKIFWLGSLADEDSGVEGAIFGGVNFEDNAGSSLSPAGDLNNDNFDDFVIVSRFGKPFFGNPEGIGVGEAYVLYGGSGSNKLSGEINLNSVGTSEITGVTINGIQTFDKTEGISDVALIPDVDSDDNGELVFGFPRVDSFCFQPLCIPSPILYPRNQLIRGDPSHFENGGAVILSSNNRALFEPDSFSSPVIRLDDVGQRFSEEDPDFVLGDVLEDREQIDDPVVPIECVNGTDQVLDTIVGPNTGFNTLLAPPLWSTIDIDPFDPAPFPPPPPAPSPFFEIIPDGTGGTSPAPEAEFVCHTLTDLNTDAICPGSGFVDGFVPGTARPLEPIGARIIGVSPDIGFGTSITVSKISDEGPFNIIISAPGRSAFTTIMGESFLNSGVAYMLDDINYWNNNAADPVPAPYQFIAGFYNYCDFDRPSYSGDPTLDNRIAGDNGDRIEVIEGIEDYNGDFRDDIAIGTPNTNRVYIAYRRSPGDEGNFFLGKLKLDPNANPERLDGMLIRSTSNDAFGSSITSGFDFNGDGFSDLVIGAPNANFNKGEIVIVYGNNGVLSPSGGISVDDLLERRTLNDKPVAIRIKGHPLDNGGFGFNVANAGDINGDGFDDLLIAAPSASPRFDPDPSDDVDELTELGIDRDQDGVADEVRGDDTLLHAGIVYVLYGGNRLDQIKTCSTGGEICNTDDDCEGVESCDENNKTISIAQLGQRNLDGFMIVGRRSKDYLGGGDAGNISQGGIVEKDGIGRSHGLTTVGDIDGDGRADIAIGAILAHPRRDPQSDEGVKNGGEVYLFYGSNAPQ